MDQTQQSPYRLTWLAIIICIVMVVPGTAIGGLVRMIYVYFFHFFISGLPSIFHDIALQWFPSLLHGLVGGAFAMAITAKILKRSNHKTVTYVTAIAWIAVMLIAWSMLATIEAVPDDTISLVAQMVGLSFGLSAGCPKNFGK